MISNHPRKSRSRDVPDVASPSFPVLPGNRKTRRANIRRTRFPSPTPSDDTIIDPLSPLNGGPRPPGDDPFIPNAAIDEFFAQTNINRADRNLFNTAVRAGIPSSSVIEPFLSSRVKNAQFTNILHQSQRTHVTDYYLTNQQINEFRRANPELKLASSRSSDLHPHPLLNDERARLEHSGYEFLTKEFGQDVKIVDVGGNPKRHQKRDRKNVWCCCPLIDGPDAFRNFFNRHVPFVCDHLVQECHCVQPDAYLSVDSVYYLKPIDIALLCLRSTKNMFVAVHHVFNDAFGSFACGEATYVMTNSHEVSMSVLGNGGPYIHSNLDWMRSNGFHFVHENENYTLVWAPLIVRAYHTVTMFTVVKKTIVLKRDTSLDFAAALYDPTYYGSANMSTALNDAAKNCVPGEIVNLENIDIHSWGPFVFLFSNGETNAHIVPKSFVLDVAIYCAGRKRTPECLQNTISYARSSVKKYNFPAGYAASSIVPCAVMGFVLHLPLETSVLHSVIQPMKNVIDVHTAALGYVFKHKFTWKQAAAVVAAASILGVAAPTVGPISLPIIAKGVLPIIVAGFSVGSVAKYLVAKYKKRNPFDPYIVDRSSLPLSNRTISLPYPIILPSTDVLSTVDEIIAKPIDITARVKIVDTDTKRKQPVPLVAAGIVSTVSIPIVPTASGLSSVASMVTRQIKRQPIHSVSGDLVLFERLRDYCAKFHDEFIPGVNKDYPIVAKPFKVWCSKFSASLAKSYERALRDLNSSVSSNVNSRDSFVKIECLSKSDTNGVASLDPRLINAAQMAHNVQTGPFCSSVGDALCVAMNPSRQYGYVYSCGLDASVIGNYFSNCLLFEDDVVSEGDFVRYDSSLHSAFIRLENEFYERCGAPTSVLDSLERSVHTQGYDRFGNCYCVEGTRHSGDPNTSNGNTIIQYLVSTFCMALQCPNDDFSLKSPLEVWSHFRVLGLLMGDDSAISHSSNLKSQQYVDDHYRLGLEIELKRHSGPFRMYNATFCSSRFYPVIDSHGRDAVVLGPPIGRVLAKAGYYSSPPHAMNIMRIVRGDALSRIQSSHCIPFLCEYWKRVIHLTQNVQSFTTSEMRRAARYNHNLNKLHFPCARTWEMIEHCYGLTQSDLEKYCVLLSNIKSLPHVIDHEMFAKAFSADGLCKNRDGDLPRNDEDVITTTLSNAPCTLIEFAAKCVESKSDLYRQAADQFHYVPEYDVNDILSL
jgi:hypothetical protein